MFRLASVWLALVVSLALAMPAHAQSRIVTISFTPTVRTQLAIWVERPDGTGFRTLRLTDAVAYRGIGNRPGALQMNSGYHWPYGRREGVLPIWAHRRYEASGHVAFPRVIFAGRTSEGDASRAGSAEVINTPDAYYCLTFSGHETLDAVSCASVFNSNKGRYLTASDLAANYGEPFEDMPGMGRMRPLTIESLYPPRGDVDCTSGCRDHADVAHYLDDRARVMPDLDAVTMATPLANTPYSYTFDVPSDWPDGDYVLFVEANTEGDFAPGWQLPTPRAPFDQWDGWATGTGYAYRGQPSVLYRVDFRIDAGGGVFTATAPIGHGDLHGLSGDAMPMSGAGITDDPAGHAGSGADRLRARMDGTRLSVTVPVTDPCRLPDPPSMCGHTCTPGDCPAPLVCGPAGTCVGQCTLDERPDAPAMLTAAPVTDPRHSHEWVHFTFVVPESMRGLASYEVRVGADPITDDASFAAARPASAATLEDAALAVPIGGAAGSTVEVDVGHLAPSSHYYVGIRAYDDCNAAGGIASVEVTTTPIHFTTVSPCFAATAAFGTPLDARIGVLRRARDRWLMSHALGRALVSAYYAVGPDAAAWIAESEERRALARTLLEPIVALAEALE
jgi:hypothetical protein